MACFSEVHTNGKVWENVVHGTGAVRHIGITLFNGFALQDAVIIGQAFQSANALSESGRHGAALYNVCLLSSTGGMIASSSSVVVWTESIDACRHADNFRALFIAGGAGARSALRDERLNPLAASRGPAQPTDIPDHRRAVVAGSSRARTALYRRCIG